MTYLIKSTTRNNRSAVLLHSKTGEYTVEITVPIDDIRCKAVKHYTTTIRRNALATYNRYCKEL